MPTPDTQSPGSVQEPASEEARTTENFLQQLWLCSWMESLSSGSGDAGGRGSGCQACRSSVRAAASGMWLQWQLQCLSSEDQAALPSRGLGLVSLGLVLNKRKR